MKKNLNTCEFIEINGFLTPEQRSNIINIDPYNDKVFMDKYEKYEEKAINIAESSITIDDEESNDTIRKRFLNAARRIMLIFVMPLLQPTDILQETFVEAVFKTSIKKSLIYMHYLAYIYPNTDIMLTVYSKRFKPLKIVYKNNRFYYNLKGNKEKRGFRNEEK